METGYIYIHNTIYPTLLAVSAEEQQLGLMYQQPPVPVMTFLYKQAENNRFWMHKTPAPLDIIFCLAGKISEICYGEPFSTRMIGSYDSDMVIELPYGSVENSNIRLGQAVGLTSATPHELKKKLFDKYAFAIKI
jgi:uncharacterized membrane protein (UPF0127 family)